MNSSQSLLLISFFCLFFVNFNDLNAAFHLSLKQNKKTIPNHTEKLNLFLQSVEEQLPQKLKEAIPFNITVAFKQLDSYKKVLAPLCPKNISEYVEFKKNNKKEAISGMTYSLPPAPAQIILNSNLIAEIIKGEENSTHFPCDLTSMYKSAQGTLIHEIAHIYDRYVPFSHDSHQHWQGDRQRTKGDWRQLKNLMGWHQEISQYLWRYPTNILQNRSPNPWEYESTAEAFAVNMSYWLLEPHYFARRPSLSLFFDHFWHHHPKQMDPSPPISRLELFKKDPLDKTPFFVDLDPERVYSIHLLKASSGKTWSSRFGHTMIHLVICSEEHRVPGPECLEDIDSHVVLTITADSRKTSFDPLRVVLGRYMAQPFLSSFTDIREEYVSEGLRNLKSYPLKIDRLAINLFVYQIIEEILSKKIRYDFYQKNCATRPLDLLKGAISNPKLQLIHPLSPSGLVSSLKKLNILQTDANIWPSDKIKLTESLSVIKKKVGTMGKNCVALKHLSLKHYISFSNDTIQRRINCYGQLLNNIKTGEITPEEGKELIYHFFVIERYILRLAELKFQKKTAKLLQKISDKNTQHRTREEEEIFQIFTTTNQLRDDLQKHYNSNLSFIGYGLPLPGEIPDWEITPEKIEAMLNSFTIHQEKVNQFLLTQLPDFLEVFGKIQEFSLTIGNHYLEELQQLDIAINRNI